jgi:hypothetical protein
MSPPSERERAKNENDERQRAEIRDGERERATNPDGEPRAALRTSCEILAASLLSFGLAELLPALPLAGVRGMLVVLPVVGALFASVARAAGGNRPGGGEVALWAGWILLALHHHSVGIPGASEMVAAAGLVLAGARALTLVVRLRRKIATSALWPFFALPLALYLLAWPWTTTARAPDGDEPYYLLLTHSLAEDFDVDLADEYRDEAWRNFTTVPVEPQPGDPTGPGGAIYSRHSALLPLALAPLYRLAGPFGAQLGMLAFAAAAAAGGLAAARARFPRHPRGILATWAILAFAPPLLLYAGQFWVEVPAALLVALVCLELARSTRTPQTAHEDGPNARRRLALVLPLVALPLLKLRLLALAVPLGALVLARLRGAGRRRRELLLLAGLSLLGLALWNFWRYGNPLRMYAASDLAIFAVPLSEQLRGDLGLFFDLAFGLFALAPIWLLVLPGALRSARRERPASEPRSAFPELTATLPYLLLIGMRREWYGGWSPAFRYGVVLLPVLALLLPPLFTAKRPSFGLRWLFATLASLTVLVALAFLVHPAWAYSLADGSSRLLDELTHGRAVDLVRLFPSMVRIRPATWIVPLVLSLAVLWIGVAATGGGRRGIRGIRGRRASGRFAWPVAATTLLLGWSSLLASAGHLPTTRIEFEDAWLSHRGGALYPERWTLDRTRFDGGWALRRDAEITVRPVAGGSICRLVIRVLPAARGDAPLALEVRAGGRLVATLSPSASEGSWMSLDTGRFAFSPGEELTFRALAPIAPIAPVGPVAPAEAGAGSLLVLDRADVEWK